MDENGQPLSTSELKSISKGWSRSTWEDYLSSLEVLRVETLLEDPTPIDQLSQEDYEKCLPGSKEEKDLPALKKVLGEIIIRLSEKQQKVLRHIFWEDLSLDEIARKYGVSKASIRRTRDRALKQAKNYYLELSQEETPKGFFP